MQVNSFLLCCSLCSSYYHKVPAELPAMDHHQVYGLATPEDFVLPPHHPLWTEDTYTAFQFSPDASEKYDTKVCLHSSLFSLSNVCVGLLIFPLLIRPPRARRRLDQCQSQTLLQGKSLSLRPSPAVPSHSPRPNYVFCQFF